jgi:hypothetical protein
MGRGIMSIFPRMADFVPVREVGIASVRHFDVGAPIAGIRQPRGRFRPTPPGSYALLLVKNSSGEMEAMMTDLAYERVTSLEVVKRAHGRMLVAGLGLGMILHPILKKRSVHRVTVVEKFPDVVDLIAPTLPNTEKLNIIAGDIFNWKPPRGARYDVIWFDIWPDVGPHRLPEMARLHRRFARYLNRSNPKCWMESWHRTEAKRILSAALGCENPRESCPDLSVDTNE